MIKVMVPATSANCCVGFDALGMALDWWASFTFEKSDELVIEGCPREFRTEENLVVQSFYKTCDYLGKEYPKFKLNIDTDIPFARGLGSSSTCVVAGILACDAWFDAQLNKMVLLELATSIEGHPDNVAPAIFGQACACFMENEKVRMSLVPCADYQALALIPDYEVKTQDARKVLPESLPFKDCVKQVSYALAFTQALSQGNELILSHACIDYLHEPYRKQFIKEYDKIKDFCFLKEIPMWISGSGSTMLCLSLEKEKLDMVSNFVDQTLKELKYRYLKVAKEGAREIYE